MADTRLENLTLALRQGAQGKAKLAGLDEQYTRANALRGSQSAKIDQYGQVSPLAAMADIINQSRGRKDMREIEPQRVAARQSIADNANAMPLYNAETAVDNTNYSRNRNIDQDLIAKNAVDYSKLRDTAADKAAVAKANQAQTNWDKNYLAGRSDSGTNFAFRGMDYDRNVNQDEQRNTQSNRMFDLDTNRFNFNKELGRDKYNLDQKRLDETIETRKGLAQAKLLAEQDRQAREDKKGQEIAKIDPSGKEHTLVYRPQTNEFLLNGKAVDDIGDWTNPAKKTQEVTQGTSYKNLDIDKRATDSIALMGGAHRIASLGSALPDQAKAELNSGSTRLREIMLDTFSPDNAKALIKSEFSGFSPEAKDFIVSISRLSAKERHDLFGSALTQTENESAGDFLNRVKGVSLDQMLSRTKDIYDYNDNLLTSYDIAGGGGKLRDAIVKSGWGEAFKPKAPATLKPVAGMTDAEKRAELGL